MTEGTKQFTNKNINIQLDDSNYLQWRQQVGFTIASHKLDRFLDGSAKVDEWISSTDGTKSRNPAVGRLKI